MQGVVESIDAEWDRIEFPYQEEKVSELLWFGDDLILQTPEPMRDALIALLKAKLAARNLSEMMLPGGDHE
jgi:hypothetical protein